MIFDTLPVTSDTSYAFTLAVSTSSDSTLYYSSVFVNVKYVPAVWAVINWSSWSNIDGTFWIQWNSGYQLSADNHSWNLIPTNTASSTPPTTSSISETSSKSKLGVIVSLAGAGISTAIIGALSIMNYSSPQGIWMVINHFQLLVLLLLTEAYFPADISSFFAGAKLFNFSFNFIPVVEFNIFNKFFNLFDFSIEIGYLDTIGLITASVLINWLNFVCSFLIWITFHILFVLAHKWTKSYSKESKTYRNAINYGYRFFTLWIYIRLILEIYQYLLIWSISEISIFNLSSTYRKISLVFAFLTFVFWLKWMGVLFWKTHKHDFESKNIIFTTFEEFFSGIKATSYAKWFSFMLVLRRLLLVGFLLWFRSINIYVKLIFITLIQIIWLGYQIFTRPLIETKNSIVNFIDEFEFLGLTCMLFFYNK